MVEIPWIYFDLHQYWHEVAEVGWIRFSMPSPEEQRDGKINAHSCSVYDEELRF